MKAATAKIIEAIDELFSDTSVSKQKTLDALEEIRDEVESKIEALRGDLKREEAS